MNKKVFTFVIVLTILLMYTIPVEAGSEVIKVNTATSTVSINYIANSYSDLKVLVKKDSNKYSYNLFSSEEIIPLQMGNGKYTVGLYQKIEGKRYKLITKKTFYLNAKENSVFLTTTQNVKWEENSATSRLAQSLTKDKQTDVEKFEAIYNYVIENFTYDYEKAKTVTSRYNPNANSMLTSKKGICYDYASLTAAMLRSVGIPTKLVKGKANVTTAYHAWNEVLLNGSWIIVDTTADADYSQKGFNVNYQKAIEDYKADKVY